MRNVVFRKMYMSILAAMLVLITTVATTFAWVGMLSTATLGGFTMNLKIEDYDNPYFLTISSYDGTSRSDFGDTVAQIDVQKQILDNMNVDYSYIDYNNPDEMNKFFRRSAMLTPVTTDKNLTRFYAMNNLGRKITDLYESNAYFKFDVYLSVDALEGIQSTTEINANVFYDNILDSIVGTNSTSSLLNGNPFTAPSYNPSTIYDPLNVLPTFNANNLTINSASAARIAFAIYDPIALTDSYDGKTPSSIRIYQGGTKTPSKDANNVYSFGGILPEEYNLAIQELDKIYTIDMKLDNVYIDGETSPYLGAKDRFDNDVDMEMIDDLAHKTLWSKATTISGTNYLGVHNDGTKSVQTKMKMTIFFWVEGFDADCFQFIDHKNVDINLTFATDKDE